MFPTDDGSMPPASAEHPRDIPQDMGSATLVDDRRSVIGDCCENPWVPIAHDRINTGSARLQEREEQIITVAEFMPWQENPTERRAASGERNVECPWFVVYAHMFSVQEKHGGVRQAPDRTDDADLTMLSTSLYSVPCRTKAHMPPRRETPKRCAVVKKAFQPPTI